MAKSSGGRILLYLLHVQLLLVQANHKEDEGNPPDHPHEDSSGLEPHAEAGTLGRQRGHVPKAIDHSVGMYMHDHPDFPVKQGAPGVGFKAEYLHASFGIGKKRSTYEDRFLKKLNRADEMEDYE